MSVSGQDVDRQLTREEKMKDAILKGKISLLGLMQVREASYSSSLVVGGWWTLSGSL